jgi:photosystem II stability/assembly factor-like uncharacterized protein
VAATYGGQIYTSTDSGVNWTPRDIDRNWNSVASSADGGKLAAATYGAQIYTSADSGVTWTPRDISRNWRSIAASSDGSKLAAVVFVGQIFTSQTDRTTPGITGSLSGEQFDSIELRYLGNDVFVPINFSSHSGNFIVQ